MNAVLRPLLLFLLACPLGASAQDAPEAVPVHLFDGSAPETLTLRADGGALRFFADDGSRQALMELPAGEAAIVRTRGNELYVHTDALSFFSLSLRAVPEAGALLHLDPQGTGTSAGARRYAGALSLTPTADARIGLVNRVPLDAYVAAVVAREYGFDDLEGAKAMAVLARTYALYRMEHGEPLADHVLSQQYDGAGRLTEAAREATRQTHGEVLTYQGALIDAVYFSSSGGHTANNEDVWNGQPQPYLRGISDPYDTASPHASWRSTVPRDRLLRLLSDTYGFKVEGFHLGDRSTDGRVRTIRLLHNDRPRREISSNEFRLFVNRHLGKTHLKSTLFDARRDGDRYVFTGRGFGHGVGMSQYGALEMSRRGRTYRDILAFYFSGVTLEQWGQASAPAYAEDQPAPPSWSTPVQPASTVSQPPTPRRRVGW